jgi:hypothetical protein
MPVERLKGHLPVEAACGYKGAMNKLRMVAALLLGVPLLVFGANYFLHVVAVLAEPGRLRALVGRDRLE